VLSEYTRILLDGRDLSVDEARLAIGSIISNGHNPVSSAAFLTALRMKGEVVDELVGAANALKNHATTVTHRQSLLLDTCGTGGDDAGTFNISTTAAFVVAAGGVPVGKHGNRAVTSRSGSADLLEALGANIALNETQVGESIDTVGIGFMFAPSLHPAMKTVAPIRKELGFRTIFNLLGPLVNPARTTHQVIGVFDQSYLLPMAHAAQALGINHVMVVHNSGGIDELAPTGQNHVASICGGELKSFSIGASDCGLAECSLSDLSGGDAETNAAIARSIFDGFPGPKSDVVAMNAGLAFLLAGKTTSMTDGVAYAKEIIDNGAAKAKLEQFIAYTRSCAHA
jgi:anthranilate phosphoribosyltransferase